MKHRYLRSVTGDVDSQSLGLILPHEHIFTDLRGPRASDYGQADYHDVVKLIKPYLDAAHKAGVSAIFECTPVGVGRNVTILRNLARETPIKIIAPTGVYKEEYHPDKYLGFDEDELAAVFIKEIVEGVDGTNVCAGFIKLAVSGDGPTDIEARNLKAAVKASMETGAAIAVHTESGAIAFQEINIFEHAQLPLNRFVWVHASIEPDFNYHVKAAEKGIYIEYDTINRSNPIELDIILENTLRMIGEGFAQNLLLSHDAGWYSPGDPGGVSLTYNVRGYSDLVETFIPMLKARGVEAETVDLITHQNPIRAFGLYK
jgi:phosphotriesterase-related protein